MFGGYLRCQSQVHIWTGTDMEGKRPNEDYDVTVLEAAKGG